MEDLIKALQIFLKYGNSRWPTHCEHDVLTVAIDPNIVSEDDIKALKALDFFTVGLEGDDEDNDCNDPCFQSFRFGSC